MLCWSEPVVLFLLLVTQSIVSDAKDHLTVGTTIVPDETGSDIVDAVVNIITRNCIFPDDHFFLRHLAMVESTDGRDIKTQTSIKYHGGIWKWNMGKSNVTLNGFISGNLNMSYLGSTLLDKHNQTFLCEKHNRNNSNTEADSKHNTVHIGNAIAKGSLKPSKTPPLHVNTILGRMGINEDDQNQLYNKSYQVVHKTEGILNNLCTQRAVKEQRKFPHPSDRKKYIICKAVSIHSIRNCHDGKYFSDSQQVCTQSNCEIPLWVNQKETVPLDKRYPNPCTIDADRVCDFIFMSHLYDPTKFIQCDKMGDAILKTCPIDWMWSNQIKACFYRHKNLTTMQICTIPIWDDPNEAGMLLPAFYPNPCNADSARVCDYIYVKDIIDNHKFIRCNRLGQALVKTCPTYSNWNVALNKCTASTIITTPKPQCPIPVWDNLNEVGTALPDYYPNPCNADSARTCDYIYIKHIIDNHKFIRCNRLGQALVKTCPAYSNWNVALNKCTTSTIITTPRPQCPIPVWDNPNEVGTALPDFYPNPCNADSARVCDYIYVKDIIDNHKFIRCDRLGHALVKTCPTSSNWNAALNKCTASTIITTPRPQCPIPVWDNPNEVGTALPDFYPNPCNADSARVCDYIYVKDIIDNHKFIRCDRLGHALVKTCPTSSNWNAALNKCTASTIITTPRPQCPIPVWDNPNEVGTALPDFYPNPCNADSARVCDYIYVKDIIDNHKFIRCDRLGHALVKTCPTSSNWNAALNKCTASTIITTPRPQCPIPVWDNPNEVGTALPDFYPNPCNADSARVCDYIYVKDIIDNHKFIRCDRLGQALVKTCPTSSNWNAALNKCTASTIITTPRPQCPIPVWDNPNEVGTALPDFYPNPCNADSARVCDYIYVKHIIDNHKFIRCNRLGQALVKTCPTSSNWNAALNKCTASTIITTPRPQCPIPVWDNPNEVGTALPDFYPNPCNADSARVCDYIYVKHIIDNHKFIRCDRLGHALVKTCPTSSNWNTALNKCTASTIITTPRPQCPIPVWDNPNEVGTALPDFYPNPCNADSARVCDYIYVKHIIDNHKFIRCDRLGQALVKTCPTSSNWNTALNKCTASTIITTPRPQCPIPVWDNPNEVGTALPNFYPNPCNADSARVCDYIYVKHIIDNHKFIRCDRLGQALVKTCPTSSNWNTALNKCTASTIITTPRPQCPIPVWDNPNEVGTALPDFYPNPCNADSARFCDYIYVKHIIDNHKFIRCDRLGHALVKTCPTSSNWNTTLNKCTASTIITTPRPQCPIPVWDNPNEVGTALPDFYPNPCNADSARVCDYIYVKDIIDNHKFIRCDRLGQALVKTCPTSSNWNTALNKCTSSTIITTPRPQCPIPVWDNPNEVGTALPDFYPNPCNADSARVCDYIYVKDIIDNHKFIRCDRLGHALVKTCPTSSNWNTALNKCTASTIITTPRPQCPIPVWDNPNEVGTALPDFYPNPCNADSARVCDYIYVKHIIDNHKFIRCDRLGQALVKTCPTSSNWNTALNKCTASTIITTPRPQCPIPVWDNPNEVGTALPDYYPNPCNADSARVCDYIYVKDIIDNHKFIRCDRLGHALVKTCPTSSNWNTALNKCTASTIITTPRPQCPIPVWDNPNEVGTALPDFYPNPCNADSARVCDYIYVKDIIDNHKFIRCDRLGHALVKTCPTSSNWNTALNTCATVVIITPIPVITTPRPQCPIPDWDNPNEAGTPLPEYYPNLCKIDFSRQCQFIYLDFNLNDHKFIQCDRSGKAVIKTCPSSRIWNSIKKQC